MPTLAARLAAVEAAIKAACVAAGRDRKSVELIAVSKTVPASEIAAAMKLGQTLFGENYAQDLRDKFPTVPSARWHFIGPLQRNKVKYVVGTAEVIHTVDSLPLAEAIAERAQKLGIKQRVLIQVNTGREPQKAGCAPLELSTLLTQLAPLGSLRVEGLMCLPPHDQPSRPHFALLQTLAKQHRLPKLSMGMSADFADAIAEGATLIRIGTAIFGERAVTTAPPPDEEPDSRK